MSEPCCRSECAEATKTAGARPGLGMWLSLLQKMRVLESLPMAPASMVDTWGGGGRAGHQPCLAVALLVGLSCHHVFTNHIKYVLL